MTQDDLKAAVAREAIKHVVEDLPVGVGTGSTANFFIDELAKFRGRIAGAVPSSEKTAERLKKHGIRILELNSVNELPIYVDGADEITEHMAMIKGGGGALTREKIVAAALTDSCWDTSARASARSRGSVDRSARPQAPCRLTIAPRKSRWRRRRS